MIEITEILTFVGFLFLAFVPSLIVTLILAVVIFALLESGDNYHGIFVLLCICGIALTWVFFILLSRGVFY